MKTSFPRKRISQQEMRHLFNGRCFWERLRSGELIAQVESENHPSPMESGQPLCTWSQMIAYFDVTNQEVEVARVHQYRRPDGSIGASGRPDPKRLLVDGIIYILKRKS
jgi:hypothetical protein